MANTETLKKAANDLLARGKRDEAAAIFEIIAARAIDAAEGKPIFDDDGEMHCCHPQGHDWAYTGTAYGGDDESYYGEGRCYCLHCGADGDG